MNRRHKWLAAGIAAGVAVMLAVGGEEAPAGETPSAAAEARFVRWEHPQGLFSADVPAGWTIDGRIDPAGLDKGAFLIQGVSPDGRSVFTFAHNWVFFMEFQYGPYRPGHATLETLVLPSLPANLPQMGLRQVRVTYRSRNVSDQLLNPQTGMPIRVDRGTLGLLAARATGEVVAGSLMGETLYIPMAGSPGLWGLRLFAGGIAPATPGDQAAIREILARVFTSLEVSAQFRHIWAQAHDQTVQRMRDYSRQMDQVMRHMSSVRERRGGGRDGLSGWDEMMREGHYETDPRTGDQHWVGNDYTTWFRNDRGDLWGSNTGQPPADNQNWHALRR